LGYDGADFRVPAVDSAGHLQVDVQGVLTGRVGSLFRWHGSGSGTSGSVIVAMPAVPAGSWLYISWVSVYASSAACALLGLLLNSPSLYGYLDRVPPPSFPSGYFRQVALLIGPGEALQASAEGLTGSLTLYVAFIGHYLAV